MLPSSDGIQCTFTASDSLFAAGVAHAAIRGVEKVHHLFPPLFERQEAIRRDWKWKPTKKLGFIAAIDPRSDRQGGLLQKAVDAGAIADPLDFRDYFPGPTPGGPTGTASPLANTVGIFEATVDSARDGQFRTRPSLAPRLNFLLGGIAGRLQPERHSMRTDRAESRSTSDARPGVLVVAHHYEIKDALLDLHSRGACVGLAFYKGLLELRWERLGLFEADFPIRFYDLTPHLEQITTIGPSRDRNGASRSTSAEFF